MLPRLPSAEVIREIRKKGGATAPPIILMMSGYKGDNRKADAQKVGAFDILVRPFTDEDFLGTVREALDLSDIGAKTMRIDTAQLVAAAASPLTSSDIFSDVLDDLVERPEGRDAPLPRLRRPRRASVRPSPAAAAPPRRSAARARPARAEDDDGAAAARHPLGTEPRPTGSVRAPGRASADRRRASAATEALQRHRRRQDPLGHALGLPAAASPGPIRA